MTALVIPAFNADKELLARDGVIRWNGPAQHFALDFSDGTFHPGVVIRIAGPAHAGLPAVAFQERPGCLAGVLHAAIRMHQQALAGAALGAGHLQRADHEFAAQMIGHRPADDLATPQIHDQRQIHPALGGRHISDVLEPDLIRAGGRWSLGQPVGRDGLVVVAVGGAGHKTRLGLRPQAMFVHQPGDPVFTALIAAGLKLFRPARTAVTGFLALPQGLDFCQQLPVGLLARRGFAHASGVITGTAHREGHAQFGQGIFFFHDLDALVTGG